MKQIPHQVGVDATVLVEKDMVDIQPKDVLAVSQLFRQLSGFRAGFYALRRGIKIRRTDTRLVITASRKDS
jgi:hypothetical protein